MGFEHRVSEEFPFPLDRDVADSFQACDRFVFGRVPANGLKSIGHALRTFDKQVLTVASLISGRSEAGKTGSLKPISLNRPELYREQNSIRVIETYEIKHAVSLSDWDRGLRDTSIRIVGQLGKLKQPPTVELSLGRQGQLAVEDGFRRLAAD